MIPERRHSLIPGNRKHTVLLLLVLLVATVNFSAAIGWGLPLAASPQTVAPWPVDTIAPVQPLAEAFNKFTRDGSEWVVYPLFHYIVLDAAYAPFVALEYLRGNLQNPSSSFPYGAVDPRSFFNGLTLLARFVSLAMALGILLTIHAITRELFSRAAALWSTLAAALLAPLAYYATTSNLDVPYLFWVMLAVWQYVLVVKRQQLISYIAFGVCGALAVATKDQAYGFFVLLPLAMAYALAHHRANGSVTLKKFVMALFSKPILVTALTVIVVFSLANNLLFGGFEGFLRHIHFASTFYAENIQTGKLNVPVATLQLALLERSVALLTNMLGPGSLLLCIGGVVYAFIQRNWLAASLLLFIAGYYAATLGVANVVLTRYLLGPALLLTPFLGALLANAFERRRTAAVAVAASIVAVCSFVWQAALSVNLNYTLLNDSRYAMESWLRTNIAAGSSVESQVQPRYLPHIADSYEVTTAANAFSAIDYELLANELTAEGLGNRNPDYVLVLKGVHLTGDPDKQDNPALHKYYADLLDGRLGYEVIARFETPRYLPLRQITAGIQPESILLGRAPAQ